MTSNLSDLPALTPILDRFFVRLVICLVLASPWTLVKAENIDEIDLKEWERKEWKITENPTDTEGLIPYEKFKLWNDCGPVSLIVEGLHEDAKIMGMTEDRIQTVIESRLREAGIYGENDPPFVYVNVNVKRSAVSIKLEFRPAVIRFGFEYVGFASTWNISSVGTFRGDASPLIIEIVAGYTDKFIKEYLHVNAPACKR